MLVTMAPHEEKREGGRAEEEEYVKLTFARIVGAVVVAGKDIGQLRAPAAVVKTLTHVELAVLDAEAVLDDVSGTADGGGLGRGDGKHGGEREKSGLHFGRLGITD